MANRKGNKAYLKAYLTNAENKLHGIHTFHTLGCDNGAGGRAYQAQIACVMNDFDTDFRVSDGAYYGYHRECKCGGGKWLSGERLENANDFIVEFCARNDFLVWSPEYEPDEVTAFCFRVTPEFMAFLVENGIVTKTVTKRDGCLWRVHHGGEKSPMWRAVQEWEWYTLEEMMSFCKAHRK